VTEADFEFLAMEALPAKIGRIRCLQPRPSEGRVAPGQVYVLVIPRVRDPRAYIPANDLEPEPEDIRLLTEYLDDRRLLTTRLDVRPPAYHWVSVRVRVRAQEGVAENNVRRQIVARLNEFLNPLVGGTEGKGWPFGRHLFPSDVYQSMQGMPGLMFVRSVEIFSARQDGRAQGPAQESIEVVSHGVIASGLHTVEFV
jgi:predicted phage baseplate assembly protein